MESEKIVTTNAGNQPGISIISLRGFIDLTTSDEVARLLETLIKSKKLNIVFDLSKADYISSSIWGTFLEKIKKIRELNGDLKLAEMTPEVYEVYKVLEMFRVINSYETLDDAIHDF
jgi:anti-sigma B factor antagonist